VNADLKFQIIKQKTLTNFSRFGSHKRASDCLLLNLIFKSSIYLFPTLCALIFMHLLKGNISHTSSFRAAKCVKVNYFGATNFSHSTTQSRCVRNFYELRRVLKNPIIRWKLKHSYHHSHHYKQYLNHLSTIRIELNYLKIELTHIRIELNYIRIECTFWHTWYPEMF